MTERWSKRMQAVRERMPGAVPLPAWARWLATIGLVGAWGSAGLLGLAAAWIGASGCFITCGDPEPALVVTGTGVVLLALGAIGVVVRWAWKGWPRQGRRGLRIVTALAIGAPVVLLSLQTLAAALGGLG